jgi:hypothetical protein
MIEPITRPMAGQRPSGAARIPIGALDVNDELCRACGDLDTAHDIENEYGEFVMCGCGCPDFVTAVADPRTEDYGHSPLTCGARKSNEPHPIGTDTDGGGVWTNGSETWNSGEPLSEEELLDALLR